MKPTIKVFISQPMAGRTEADILGERSHIKSIFTDIYSEVFDVEFIETYDQEEGLSALEMLGESIKKLADADIFVEAPGAWKARGCMVEENAARNYDIPIRFINVNHGYDNKVNSIFNDTIWVNDWKWEEKYDKCIEPRY